MRLQFFILLSILGLVSTSAAEYRVFQLVIENTTTKKKREFLSTLDPFQYTTYYPVLSSESISYTDTWMCWGDTSYNKDYCPKPNRNPAAVKTPPASETQETDTL